MKLILILLLLLVVLIVGFSIAAAVIAWLVLKWMVILAFFVGFALFYLPSGEPIYGIAGGVGSALLALLLLFRQE